MGSRKSRKAALTSTARPKAMRRSAGEDATCRSGCNTRDRSLTRFSTWTRSRSNVGAMPNVSNGSSMGGLLDYQPEWLCVERVAAAAALLLVGVSELEALVHERLLPVERRARQVNETLGIDENPHVVEFEHSVALSRRAVGEFDDVGEARAAAAAQSQPDRRLG